MEILEPYEKTLYELTNGVRHGKHIWADPITIEHASYLYGEQGDTPEWLLLITSAEDQLGRSGSYAWRKVVEKAVHARKGTHTPPAESVIEKALPIAPPLPKTAYINSTLALDAAPWLDEYVSHSATWSPRAAQGFHTAVGLWILSTIAARRIAVELGDDIYPTLFMALVARSTLYAKTTTAKIGIDALRESGCGHLLAPDRATPQALLRSMAGHVPDDYGSLPPEKQELLRLRTAFAAQRGWYFEEWGGLLQQMTRRDSPMSEFHGLLRVLDDGYDTFDSETIQRGLDHVDKPYLALLGSATPHDLAKFLAPGAAWWHDGFWPRIALIVPYPEEKPSLKQRPLGSARLTGSLIKALQQWHQRLGIPDAAIDPATNAEGKLTGKWRASRAPLPCQHLVFPPSVKEAYDAYNTALMELIIQGDAPPDLEACYGRLHDKALRIAMLLSSFAGEHALTVATWTYAQQITESWRVMLHQVVEMAFDSQPKGREEQLDDKIESLLLRYGHMTARRITDYIRGYSSAEINRALAALLQAGRVSKDQEGRTWLYSLEPGRQADNVPPVTNEHVGINGKVPTLPTAESADDRV